MTDAVPDRHDVIIVGAGVAGARLLQHLFASGWQTRRILVIERDAGGRHDHALAYWTGGRTDLDPLIEHRWTALRVVAPDGEAREYEVTDPQYVATRRARITARVEGPNLRWLTGEVEEVVDGADEAAVRVGDRWLRAAWVFDARRGAPGPATVRLVQRFTGWIVESVALRLDPGVATLFDFRTAQRGGVGFMYVLPLAPGRALVEHVFTGPVGAEPPASEALLSIYLAEQLGLAAGDFQVVGRERGRSLLSDARHPRRAGRRICNIGARGGRLKASSGYALTRIEADSAAIVRSLTKHGDPFHLPRERWLYRVLDAIFLWVLAREPGRAPAIYGALMRRPAAMLRFLDERPRLRELPGLLLALPTWVFLRALWRWSWARRVAEPGPHELRPPAAATGVAPRDATQSDGAERR
jgi:lycopene beta-cyclase